MPNFGYHFARAQGAAVRRIYAASLPALVRRKIIPSRNVPFDVFAYSSEADLPEQVASIRSFLRFAGRPLRFTVVSDGTHSPRSLSLLESIDHSVQVRHAQDFCSRSEPYFADHPTGKQLALIMSLPSDGPALYFDSDVLFFPGASRLANFESERAAYMPDCQLAADERLFRAEAERLSPVNTGVLFLPEKLDWSLSLQRLSELKGAPTFFTNQTMTHLAMHAAGALPFDPTAFILQLDDQFVYADHHAKSGLALRHYVRPVRHKFWTTLANFRWNP